MNEQTIFLSSHGGKFSSTGLATRVGQIIRKAQIGKTGSCHIFRHTFATVLLESGCDVRYVQAMLGHASLESTQVYTHVSVRKIKEMHARHHPARLPKDGG